MLHSDDGGHERVQLQSGGSLACADDNVYFYEEISDTGLHNDHQEKVACPLLLPAFLSFLFCLLYTLHTKRAHYSFILHRGHYNFS